MQPQKRSSLWLNHSFWGMLLSSFQWRQATCIGRPSQRQWQSSAQCLKLVGAVRQSPKWPEILISESDPNLPDLLKDLLTLDLRRQTAKPSHLISYLVCLFCLPHSLHWEAGSGTPFSLHLAATLLLAADLVTAFVTALAPDLDLGGRTSQIPITISAHFAWNSWNLLLEIYETESEWLYILFYFPSPFTSPFWWFLPQPPRVHHGPSVPRLRAKLGAKPCQPWAWRKWGRPPSQFQI